MDKENTEPITISTSKLVSGYVINLQKDISLPGMVKGTDFYRAATEVFL